jgi:hypothetical protein
MTPSHRGLFTQGLRLAPVEISNTVTGIQHLVSIKRVIRLKILIYECSAGSPDQKKLMKHGRLVIVNQLYFHWELRHVTVRMAYRRNPEMTHGHIGFTNRLSS